MAEVCRESSGKTIGGGLDISRGDDVVQCKGGSLNKRRTRDLKNWSGDGVVQGRFG